MEQIANPWHIGTFDITLRLFVALLLGGLVGLEREQNNHPAGFRTHILVCLGSALIMLLSVYGFNEFVNEINVRIDPARLAANVITGVGFLGAGTIVFNGASISGLTTAASLWVVAAIGLAVGAGFYYPAVISTVFVLISLWVLNRVEKRLFGRKRTNLIRLDMWDRPGALASVSAVLASRGIDIRRASIDEKRGPKEEENRITVALLVKLPGPGILLPVLDELKQLKGVTGVVVE